MISKKMEAALNEQVNKELYSAYLYQSMSAYADQLGYNGIANWFSAQAQEEVSHARKLYDYILEQDGKVVLEQIDKPATDFDSVHDMFAKSLEHEKFITDSIDKLMDLADAEKDRATHIMLHWFVSEQVEEEASVKEILDKLEMISDSKHAFYMLDKELGARGADSD